MIFVFFLNINIIINNLMLLILCKYIYIYIYVYPNIGPLKSAINSKNLNGLGTYFCPYPYPKIFRLFFLGWTHFPNDQKIILSPYR